MLDVTVRRKLLASNTTNATFSMAVAMVAAKPADMTSMEEHDQVFRGGEVIFFGVGAVGNTFNYKIWLVDPSTSSSGGVCDDYEQQLLCSGVVTLGSVAGVSAKGATTADRIASGITVVLDNFATAMCTAYAGVLPTVHSPTPNGGAGIAVLFLPELGNRRFFKIELQVPGGAGSATSANAYVKRGV